MHILALDPATQTGVARWSAPDEFWSGTYKWSGSVGARLSEAEKYLSHKFVYFANVGRPITAVYCEGYNSEAFRGGESSFRSNDFLTKIQGVIQMACHRGKVRLEFVAPATWRKTFFDFGRMPEGCKSGWKTLARDRCAQLGIKVQSADEAEAVGILHHARCVEDPHFGAYSTPLLRTIA